MMEMDLSKIIITGRDFKIKAIEHVTKEVRSHVILGVMIFEDT